MDIGILLALALSAFAMLFLIIYFHLRRRKTATAARKTRRSAECSSVFLLTPALLGLFACLFSLCGLTYAWYSSVTAGTVQSIRSATFGIDAMCASGGESLTSGVTQKDGFEFSLSEGKEYQLTISPSADSTALRGFCQISITAADERLYATAALPPGSRCSLTIRTGQAASVRIIPIWGKCPDGEPIQDGGIIEIPTPPEATADVSSVAPTNSVPESAAGSDMPSEIPEESSSPSESCSAEESASTEDELPSEAPPGWADELPSPDEPNGQTP